MVAPTNTATFNHITEVTFTGSTWTAGSSVSGSFTMTNIDLQNAGYETPPTGGDADVVKITGAGKPATLGTAFYQGSGGTYRPIILGSDGKYYILSNSPIPAFPLNNGTLDAVDFTYCYLKDTLILTPEGKKKIQELNINDEILNHDQKSIKIKWIGKQIINPVFAKLNKELPIKISANAIDINIPERDLFLSPDHSIFLEGLMINAKALVNGHTIYQVSEWKDDVEYYHIMTENHEIIYSEGVPSETLHLNDEIQLNKFINAYELKEAFPNRLFMERINLPFIQYPRQVPQFIKNKLQLRINELSKKFQLKKSA